MYLSLQKPFGWTSSQPHYDMHVSDGQSPCLSHKKLQSLFEKENPSNSLHYYYAMDLRFRVETRFDYYRRWKTVT